MSTVVDTTIYGINGIVMDAVKKALEFNDLRTAKS